MAAEQLREEIDSAVKAAIVGDADLGEIEQALVDAQQRVEAARAYQEAGS
jgi:hypothetical protein